MLEYFGSIYNFVLFWRKQKRWGPNFDADTILGVTWDIQVIWGLLIFILATNFLSIVSAYFFVGWTGMRIHRMCQDAKLGTNVSVRHCRYVTYKEKENMIHSWIEVYIPSTFPLF